MLRKFFKSHLTQAGAVLVVLGGAVEVLDQLDAVDLSAVPYVGHYAPSIVASVGLLKIALRLSIALLAAVGSAGK